MSPRPDPESQSVSNAISVENIAEPGNGVASGLNHDEGSATSNISSPRIHSPVGGVTMRRPRSNLNDVYFLACIFLMLLWPWVFLATIWAQGGVQLSVHATKAVNNHPQRISFFVTLLGNIVSIIVGTIFSTAVVRFSQEWAINNDHVTVFDVSLISAFKNQSWPWEIQDLKYLLVRNRWLLVVLAGTCMAAFALVPSGTTSLITPVSFHRTWSLTGTELDLSQLNNNCMDWIVVNVGLNPCDYFGFYGFGGSNTNSKGPCEGVDQLVNLLESGRSNIQSLFSNNSETLVLGQLGANYSLRFLGPPRGVLPMGYNAIHGLRTIPPSPLANTLRLSPLSHAETNAAILSYNYTLDHQGLASNISCIYDTQSPIRFSAVPNNTVVVNAQGFCNETGLAEFLSPADAVQMIDTSQTLTFWACMSPKGQDLAYYIYLRGRGDIYEKHIGNITCTVSSIQSAIFSVTYQSSTRVFSTQEHNTTSAPSASLSYFVDHAIWIFGIAVQLAQTATVNLVADSIAVLGIQAMGFGPYEQNKQYLPIYEAMIQGMLVDDITYMRFLYSNTTANNFNSPLPEFCHNRTVSGMLSAEVTGWVAKPVHIGFLMPMTILNIASLIIMSRSILRAKRGYHEFDLTDPRSLISAECNLHESDHSGWADGVSYRSRESVMFQRSTKKAST